MSEWQPIETAPKDGAWLVLWDHDCAVVGRWVEPNEDFIDGGWAYPVDGMMWACYPTHWTTFPPPPQQA